MKPVTRVDGRAILLGRPNIDTDIIIPARHLKTVTREGLGAHAFETIRAEPGNPLDAPEAAGAPVLIAGENFGCGSSREHAVWAMMDLGIRAVLAPSFSDIFAGNAFKNGLVAATMSREAIDQLLDVVGSDPVCVDLETMTVTTPRQHRFEFHLDPFRRACLLEGQSEVSLTLRSVAAIEAYEARAMVPAPVR